VSKINTQTIVFFLFICFVAFFAILNVTNQPQPEITEAAASEVRLTTSELVVINQQEAKLLELQSQIEKLTLEADNTAKTIENLETAKCSYKELKTCDALLLVTIPATETPVTDPKVQGVR